MIPHEGRAATAMTSCQPRQEPNESAPPYAKGGRSERQLAEALVTQDWLGRPETAPGSHGAGRGPPRPARETCQRQLRPRTVCASETCLCPDYRAARGRVGQPRGAAGGHLPLGGPSSGDGIVMSRAGSTPVAPAGYVQLWADALSFFSVVCELTANRMAGQHPVDRGGSTVSTVTRRE